MRILRHLSFGVAALLYALCASPVHADSIRQHIFDNCEEALNQVAIMPQSERQRLLLYLRLLLELKSERLAVASPLDQYADMPLEGLRAPAYSQLLESEREDRAKGCALSVIEHLGMDALAALPELFQIAQENSPRGSRARIIVQRLAEGMTDKDSAPGLPGAIEELAADYEREPHPQALELFARVPARATAVLLDRFERGDTATRPLLGEAILTLDPSGVLTGDRLLSLLEAEDPQLVNDASGLLSRMPGVYGETVPRILELLTSGRPVHRVVLAKALTHILSQPESSAARIDSSVMTWAAGLLRSESDVERDLGAALLKCTAPHPTKVEEEILTLLTDPNSKEARQGLEILASYPQLRDRTFARLVELIDDEAVSDQAMMALSSLRSRRTQVLAALLRRAKAVEGELSRLEPVAEALLRLGLANDSGSFGPVFGTGLVGFLRCESSQFEHSRLLEYFRTQKPFAERVLFERLRSGLVGERCAVLHVLGKSSEISEQGYAALASSVQESDPAVAWIALGILVERARWQELLKNTKQFLAADVERAITILRSQDASESINACKTLSPVFNDALAAALTDRCRQLLQTPEVTRQ